MTNIIKDTYIEGKEIGMQLIVDIHHMLKNNKSEAEIIKKTGCSEKELQLAKKLL